MYEARHQRLLSRGEFLHRLLHLFHWNEKL
jgi:hypothetical protein